MPEPVFSAEDRVSTELPAELRGVTDPVKIAQYYQRREATLREELRQRQPNQQTRVQIEQRTDDAQRQQQQSATFSVEEATAARQTLIKAARVTAQQGKKYWERLSADIEKLMATLAPESQVDSNIWETAYNSLLGANMDRLIREDTETAANATRIAAERSSAAAEVSAQPAPLPIEVTAKVLPGLGISEKQYRESQDNINKGVWPLTAENSRGERVTIGNERR